MGDAHASNSSSGNGIDTGKSSRCVVLAPEGKTSPEPLILGLNRRGIQARTVGNPVEVMVELAGGYTSNLVVSQPDQIAQTRELLAAVKRYYPEVSCWRYVAATNGRRARFTRFGNKPDQTSDEGVVPKETNGHRPRTEVEDDDKPVQEGTYRRARVIEKTVPEPDRVGSDGSIGHPGQESPIEPLLTAEELSMLIGPPFNESNEDSDDTGETELDRR